VSSHVDLLGVRLETYMDRPLGYILPSPVNDVGRTSFTIRGLCGELFYLKQEYIHDVLQQ
jgi:hypothetical protein